MRGDVVRIFAEWSTDSPLWMGGDDQAVISLTAGLTADLATWNRRWEELAADLDHEDDDSWKTWPAALEWNAEGYRLARLVRAQLPAETRLVYYDYITGRDVIIDIAA